MNSWTQQSPYVHFTALVHGLLGAGASSGQPLFLSDSHDQWEKS